jgi:hypothetical protein
VDIYWVAVYYVLFRWLFNLAWGRASLLNWPKELVFSVAIVGGSWWLYDAVIQVRGNLLPDPSSLATEVWLVMAVYLFYMANQLGGADEGSRQRKHRYVLSRARRLRTRYEAELLTGIPGENHRIEALILAVMVYESFNRPFAARLLEYGAFTVGRAKTLGLMQVSTARMIGDRTSVRLGIERVVRSWEAHKHLWDDDDIAWAIARDYNPDNDYAREVVNLADAIFAGVYGDSSHRLNARAPLAPLEYEPLLNPDTGGQDRGC